MKVFFRNCLLLVAVALGVSSCEVAQVDEDIAMNIERAELYATTAMPDFTRVDFTDNSTLGIALEWEVADEFTVYDASGNRVGDFKCSSVTNGVGAFEGVSLTEGASYVAIYPATTAATLSAAQSADLTSVQSGDDIDDLDAACMMEAVFTYEAETTISFVHQKAVVTMTFASDSRPAKMVFENGATSYTVNYSTIEAVDGYYTSHIMVEPCSGDERELTFSLYNANGVAYDVRSVTSTVPYVAGLRYIASVSDIEVTSEAPTVSMFVCQTSSFIYATVDNESKTISIAGVTDSLQIVAVYPNLSNGAVMYPDPTTFVGCWPETTTVTLTANGVSVDYTITLADYIHREVITITDEDVTSAGYVNSYIILEGAGTLTLTGDPSTVLDNSYISINSPEARVYLTDSYLDDWTTLAPYFLRDDATTQLVDGDNCQVLGYYDHIYVKTKDDAYAAAIIYNAAGESAEIEESTIYTGSSIPLGDNTVTSVLLRRGFQLVVAASTDGITSSKCYQAINYDRYITLDADLAGQVSFVRVVAFSYINKRSICGKSYLTLAHAQLDLGWYYTWGVTATSTADLDFVPMFWSGSWVSNTNIAAIIAAPYTTTALAFNEPDNKDQANMEVSYALELYPKLLQMGVRLGSPATEQVGTTAGWTNTAKWAVQFMDGAIEAGYRVDFLALHWYDVGYASNLSTATYMASVNRLSAHIDACYAAYGLPIWLTEFNVGTSNGWAIHEPFFDPVCQMLEAKSEVERYSYYPSGSSISPFVSGDGPSAYGELYLNTPSTPSIVPTWEEKNHWDLPTAN